MSSKRKSRDDYHVYPPPPVPHINEVKTVILGDFKIYERLKYHRPFKVLFDTLFLEGYLLPGGNYAVESIEDLVGGPCIFLFTNYVLRNITQKRLGIHMTGLITEEYHCKDSIDYSRTDFDCLTEVIKEDGIKERIILATGDKRLKGLIRKISAVPILYVSNNEKPKSRRGAHDIEVKDEEDMPREVLFEVHHEERNIMNMLNEGFILHMLQYQRHLKRIINRISRLLGHKVVLFSTRCALKKKKPSPHICWVHCGHTDPRPVSDDCIVSVVKKPEFGMYFVATASKILKKRLSKMRFVTVISFKGFEIILNKPKATVEKEARDHPVMDEVNGSKESQKDDDKERSMNKRRKLEKVLEMLKKYDQKKEVVSPEISLRHL
ncbi:hypothetical protein CTI12_AA008150 [Artemisia annua]|uniref:PIN domain-like family protein n=1 Tax=Artemisia annua TaxID=35608 RepID=A0A2U1QN46_ARTAN|nr:hypothetical protein CTI12_AA008150 [Artemisia annua]